MQAKRSTQNKHNQQPSPKYTDADYHIASTIIEEALKTSQSQNSYYKQPGKLDKLTLIQAYETILRSEGILPVSDSKIYNLVFKVFEKCEGQLQQANKNSKSFNNDLMESLNAEKQKDVLKQTANSYYDYNLKKKCLSMMGQIKSGSYSLEKENIGPQNQRMFISGPSLEAEKKKQNIMDMPRKFPNSNKSSAMKPFLSKNQSNAYYQTSQSFVTNQVPPNFSFVNTSAAASQHNLIHHQNSLLQSSINDIMQDNDQTYNNISQQHFQQHQQNINTSQSLKHMNTYERWINNIGGVDNIPTREYNNHFMKQNIPSFGLNNNNNNNNTNQTESSILYQNQSYDYKRDPNESHDQYKSNSMNFKNLQTQSSSQSLKGNVNHMKNYATQQHHNHTLNQIHDQSYFSDKNAQNNSNLRNIYSSFQNLNLNNTYSTERHNTGKNAKWIIKKEEDYRVLFTYLRYWQKAITRIKRNRVLKKRLLQNLATAIHFHEQSLMSKVLLSLVKYRYVLQQTEINGQICQQMVTQNILKFYFKQLMKKFKEAQWIKSGNSFAVMFLQRNIKRKVLTSWKSTASSLKLQKLNMQKRISKKYKEINVWLQFIGGQYTGNKKSFNLLEFHAIAIKNKLIRKKSKSEFSQTVEGILMRKICTIFYAWKYMTNSIIKFKNKMLMKQAKISLNALKYQANLTKRMILAIINRQKFIQYQCISKLIAYSHYRKQLKGKGRIVQKKQQSKTEKLFFSNWYLLHQQYQGLMQENTQNTKISKYSFLKKFFLAIKSYSSQRLFKKSQYQKSLMQYYEYYTKNCFQNWKVNSRREKRLRKLKWKIQLATTLSTKSTYFYQWIRKCYIMEMSKKIRVNALMRKGFGLLQKNIKYNHILEQVKVISQQQYGQQLMKRSIQGIKQIIASKSQYKNIQNIINRNVSKRILRIAYQGLVINIKEKQARRINRFKGFQLRKQLVLKKGFTGLKNGIRKLQILKYGEERMNNKIEKRIKFRIFSKMIQKINRKVDLRIRLQHYWENKNYQILKQYFYFMLSRFYGLKSKHQFIAERRYMRQQATFFYSWFQKTHKRMDFRYKLTNFMITHDQQRFSRVFKEWAKYTADQQIGRKLKKVAAIVFLQKYMKKYLIALRKYALIKKLNRTIAEKNRIRLMRRSFRTLSRKIKDQKCEKLIRIGDIKLRLSKHLTIWKNIFAYKSMLLQKGQLIQQQRNLRLMKEAFSGLFMNKQIGDETQNQICERAQQQLLWTKASRIINFLRSYTEWRVQMKQKQRSLEKINQDYLKAKYLKEWHYEYYLTRLHSDVVQPFQQNKLQFTLEQAFDSLKNYYQLKKEQKSLILQGIQNSKMRSQKNVMQALYQNKEKIKYYRGLLASNDKNKLQRLLQETFCKLFKYKLRKQSMRQIAQTIQENSVWYLQQRFLTMWQKANVSIQLNKIQNESMHILQDSIEYDELASPLYTLSASKKQYTEILRIKQKHESAEAMYRYQLALKTMNSFRSFLTYRRQKYEMMNSIDIYREEKQNIKDMKLKGAYLQQWIASYKFVMKIKKIEWNLQRVQQFKEVRKRLMIKQVLTAFRLRKLQILKINDNIKLIQKEQRIRTLKKIMIEFKKHQQKCQKVKINLFNKNQINKSKIFKSIRNYTMTQFKQKQAIIQSDASNKLRLQRKLILTLVSYQSYRQQMRKNYKKTSKIYRQQLLSKSFMTLQWNLMRTKYLQGLVEKSLSHNDQRLKAALFKFFKDQLIRKYKGMQLRQFTQLKQMNECFDSWKYHFILRKKLQSERDYMNPIMIRNGSAEINNEIVGNLKCIDGGSIGGQQQYHYNTEEINEQERLTDYYSNI